MTSDRLVLTRRVVVATVLTALSLVAHVRLASELDRRHVFDQRNVLFDTDPDTRLAAISEGLHLGIKHPNMMPYFSPAIFLAARTIDVLGLSVKSEPALRRALGTLMVPLATGLTTLLTFALLTSLGYSTVQATIATILGMVSFSRLVFGSIPESYGFTALAMAVAYLLAARKPIEDTGKRMAVWILLGVFAMGVTIVNVALVGLVFWGCELFRGAPRMTATIRSIAVVAAIFALTGFSSIVLERITLPSPQPSDAPTTVTSPETGGAEESARPDPQNEKRPQDAGASGGGLVTRIYDEFRRYVAENPLRRFAHFPTSVANTFSPPELGRTDVNAPGVIRSGFTLRDAPNVLAFGDPLGLLLVVLIAAGAWVGLHGPPVQKSIVVGSLGVLAFSLLLSVWGDEVYLYSQNWQLASVLLLVGLMRTDRYQKGITIALGLLTAVVAVRNAMLLNDLFGQLAV